MRYLLADKTGELQVVIANPENDRFKDNSFPYHPNSLAARTLELFQKCGAGVNVLGSYSEPDKRVTPEHSQVGHQHTITCYSDFCDFIEWEL